MIKLNPENPQELQQLLHAGMGRAILFLMNQVTSQYRDVILDECLHDYSYESPCEDNAVYLYPLLKASGELEYYRDAILGALPESENKYDTQQLLDFAVLFARDGYQQARTAIYDRLRSSTGELRCGYDQAIELDGISGLISCLELLSSDPGVLEPYEYDCMLEAAEGITSVDEVRLALIEAARENPSVARTLAGIKHYSPEWSEDEILDKREERRQCLFDTDEIITEETTWEEVKSSSEFRSLVFPWRRLACDSEFEKAAYDLDIDADPKLLASFLLLFEKRPFPMDPDKLIQLVDHLDEKVACRALTALRNVHHPDVRALFARIVKHPELSYRAVELIQSNYETGDDKVIMHLLETESDQENLHKLCIDVMNTYSANPTPEGMDPLLLVYELDPCSVCRNKCIKTIQTLGELPDWMIEECRYDSDSGTREIAEMLSGSS